VDRFQIYFDLHGRMTVPRTNNTRRRRSREPQQQTASAQKREILERKTTKSAVNDKRAEFAETTRNTLAMLMENHGYSRERAIATLRDTILTDASKDADTCESVQYHPSDMEVRMESFYIFDANLWRMMTLSHA
jgi:hypothetical protein